MPKLKTLGDIHGLHATLLMRHRARVDQQLADERLWRLEKYILEEIATWAPERQQDWPCFTSNEPRNYANVVLDALTKYPVRFRGDTYETESEQGQDEISAHERFATGMWRMVDEVRARRVEMPFQWDLAWFNAIRGGSIIRTWLATDREDPFDVALFDPVECVWDVGSDDLAYFCRHYMAYKKDVEDRWDVTVQASDQGTVEVWDSWEVEGDHVYNAVVTGKEWLKELTDETEAHRQKRIPVQITRASGAPVTEKVEERGNTTYQVDRWDSIYAPNRTMYAWYNRVASLFGFYIRNGGVGPWVNIGEPVPNIQEALKPFSVVNKPDGSFGPASMPQMAQEAKQMFAAVSGHLQRGSVPFAVYGEAPFELSGVAISQLQGAIDIALDPQRQAMRTAYRGVTEEAIRQFIARGRKLRLQGIDRRNRPFWQEFGRQQLATKYYLDVEIRADLPLLREQEATVAAQWRQLGVSLLTIYDELLHFQDPNAEYRRWLAEQADANPIVAGIKLAEELTRRAQQAALANAPDEAQRFQQYAQVVLQQIGQAMSPPSELPAGGQGARPALPPPEVLPPEMAGRQTGEFVPSAQHVSNEDRMRMMGLEMAR